MDHAGKPRGGSYFLAAQHQLRQPLNALSLLIGELRQSTDSGDRAAIVDDMRYALSLSNAWLDSLADLEKAEEGLLRVQPQVVQLQQVFGRLHDEFRPQFDRLGLDFHVVPTGALVRGDPAVLRRLLSLLLDNAAKFTRDGKVLLGCRRAGGRWRVEVRDTGRGVAAQETERLFEPFFRLENEVRPRERGLGLGLAYARRLAELSGAELTAASQPGRGSCFALSLQPAEAAPAAARGNGAPEAGQFDAAPSEGMGNPLAGAAVLLLEGAEAAGLQSSLNAWGAVAKVVPASGLAAALAEAPDLLIADRQAFEGAQGAEMLRQSASPAAVVLITARHPGNGADGAPQGSLPERGFSEDGRHESVSAGQGTTIHFLERPVKAARLRALCHYALSRH